MQGYITYDEAGAGTGYTYEIALMWAWVYHEVSVPEKKKNGKVYTAGSRHSDAETIDIQEHYD